jgi:hypothetical protein
VDNKNDGFLKFLPGSAKSKAKTKNSVLVRMELTLKKKHIVPVNCFYIFQVIRSAQRQS